MTQIPNDIFKPENQTQTNGKAVLILTADKTEDTEFFYPYYRFIEEGCKVDVVTPDGGEFKGKNGSGLKETKKIEAVDPNSYDLLYIPGGKAPEKLKNVEEALELVKKFTVTGKPIAAICHGPQVLAEAGVIQGCKVTAWPEVAEEVTNAGATYLNQETLIDRQFITARWPGDLPAFTAKVLEVLGVSSKQSASKRQAA